MEYCFRVLAQVVGTPFFDKRGVKGVIYLEYSEVLKIFTHGVNGQDLFPEAPLSNPVGAADYLTPIKLFGVNLTDPAPVAVARRANGDQRRKAVENKAPGTVEDFVIVESRCVHGLAKQ